MCPVCLANMALVAASATSTAGVTALVTKKLFSKMAGKKARPETEIKGETR